MIRVWMDEAAQFTKRAWNALFASQSMTPEWAQPVRALREALDTWREAQEELCAFATGLEREVALLTFTIEAEMPVMSQKLQALLDSAEQLRTAVNSLSDLVAEHQGECCGRCEPSDSQCGERSSPKPNGVGHG